MFFDEEFIHKVEENPVIGIVDACKSISSRLEQLDLGGDSGWTEKEHEFLWESAAFLQLVIEQSGLVVNTSLPKATSDVSNNCAELYNYVTEVKEEFEAHAIQLKIQAYKSRYAGALKNSFAYEFSEGDLNRVQTLLNELRTHITENQSLEKSHRQRLLKRLEALQAELHKRVSDLDRFWGLVGDAGVVLGKLGTDAKPIVDRIRELAQISWSTQARAEELPSNTPNPMIENN